MINWEELRGPEIGNGHIGQYIVYNYVLMYRVIQIIWIENSKCYIPIIFNFDTQKRKRFNTKNIIGVIQGDPDGRAGCLGTYTAIIV